MHWTILFRLKHSALDQALVLKGVKGALWVNRLSLTISCCLSLSVLVLQHWHVLCERNNFEGRSFYPGTEPALKQGPIVQMGFCPSDKARSPKQDIYS